MPGHGPTRRSSPGARSLDGVDEVFRTRARIDVARSTAPYFAGAMGLAHVASVFRSKPDGQEELP